MAVPIRVLHVDDDPTLVETTADILERENDRFEVETTTSADEALDRLPSNIDCVVSDYEMPETDGIELLEAVREEYPELPFILYTGKGSEAVASEAISAGVTDYLQKGSGTGQYAVLANRVENAVSKYRAQLALQENRQRLELFLNQSPLGIIEWNTDYEVVTLNDAAESILGYEESEVRGESWELFVPEKDRTAAAEAIDRLLSTGEGYDGVYETVCADGERIVCEWHNRVVTDDEGETVAVFSLFQDVTERVERKERLQRYEQIVESTDDAAFVVDEDRTITYANSSSLENVNLTRPDAHGASVIDLVEAFAADDAGSERFGRALDCAFDDRAEVPPDPLELTLAVDGERAVFEYRFAPIVEDGRTAAVAVTSRDVTERKRREQELERHREYTELIFDAIDDLFYIHDETGSLTRWNESFTEVTGYIDEEIASMHGREFVPEPHRDRAEAAIREVFETGSGRLQAPLLTKDGSTIDYEFLANRVTDPDGNPQLVGIGRDITERKARKRELERQNDRLAEFASVVSHDLRSPLRAAGSYLELAGEDCESDHLASVGRCHDRMEALIEDLLTLAQEGEPVTAVEPVALPEVIADTWAATETRDATLTVDVDGTLRADRSRLRQLLENLVRNSVEHAGDDAVITVTTATEGAGFAVADDGPGIPPAERTDVFETGYSTAEGGTGFGLSIVEEIAEAHGWTVRVSESDDGGARFEITGIDWCDDGESAAGGETSGDE